MDDKERADVLWRVIARIDAYIISTNGKAAAAIAYNALIAGGIIFRFAEISRTFDANPHAEVIAKIILSLIALVSLVSIWCAIRSVLPDTSSPAEPGVYHSILFYGHIAKHGDAEKYFDVVGKIESNTLLKDLAAQSHTVAKIADRKFALTKVGFGIILWGQLPLVALLLVERLWVWLL